MKTKKELINKAKTDLENANANWGKSYDDLEKAEAMPDDEVGK